MLRRRSVRMRIIVLVLVPVIALLGLYALMLTLTTGTFASLRQAETVRSDVTQPVTTIQLQLSRERQAALLYLADPTRTRLSVLLGREAKTDAAIQTFTTLTSTVLARAAAGERQAIMTWSTQLGALRELRGTVVSLGFSRASAATSYSTIDLEGDNVINQALVPLLSTPGVFQANDLVLLEESLQAEGEESNLFSADLLAHSYPLADQHLMNQLVVEHKDLWNQGLANLDPAYRKIFAADIPASAVSQLAGLETRIGTGPRAALRISPATWNSVTHSYNTGFVKALYGGANALRDVAVAQARSLVLRLILISGLGLLAIAAAIAIGVVISRNLLKELDDLRTSAIALSSERLPAVLTRLRSGGEIDVENDTPQLAIEDNEIGQLRQAINYTARAAIGAAIDEVAIRRGVNDVFRNLARRNQSLLTRQLELLDAMERRVHDPEELADLFRVDHLTTRMRRHAEGLLIVAGGSSGRVWREPVPVIDVMRAAVAEVEDYTRIRVTSRSSASVAGHAVADIIHLLAELVENATTFSPANTPVRIESDNVAKGLIVEIEDRGLGIGDEQLAQINKRLSDPPLFDLSGSEQLGLYIAGQLASRHEVRVTMRGSAYGGVIAVVLIPSALIVDAGYDEPPTVVGIRELGGRPVPQLPASSGRAENGSAPQLADASYPGSTGYLANLDASATAVDPAASLPGTGPLGLDSHSAWPADEDTWAGQSIPAGFGDLDEAPGPDSDQPAGPASGWLNLTSTTTADPFSTAGTPGTPGFDELPQRTAQVPQGTGWPLGGSSFFTASDRGEPAGPPGLTDDLDDASMLPKRQPQAPSLFFAQDFAGPDDGEAGLGEAGAALGFGGQEADLAQTREFDALPTRVRQASLAPQLRDQTRASAPASAQSHQYVPAPDMPAAGFEGAGFQGAGLEGAGLEGAEPSPEAARSLMSSLQRGWERGRSVAEHLAEDQDGEQT
jgi:anti-sigma regulatory factor (Ser/Thr protein kinase)